MSGNKNKNKHSYIQTYGNNSSNNNFKTNSRFTRSKKLPQRLWMHYMPMNAEQTHLEAFLSFPTLHTFFYHWKHHNYRFRHNHSHGTTSHWEDNLIISTLSLSRYCNWETYYVRVCRYYLLQREWFGFPNPQRLYLCGMNRFLLFSDAYLKYDSF